MFMKSVIGLSFIACALIGCGGDDTATSTTDDLAVSGSGGNDLAGTKLQSGTYAVSNIQKVSDGCGLVFEGDAGDPPLAQLQVLNTGTALSLGTHYDSASNPMWSPAGYAGGTGMYTDATHATLMVTTTATLSDSCSYSLVRTSKVTFTGNNAVTVDFTDSESNQSASCLTNKDQATACTSEYTFNLTM